MYCCCCRCRQSMKQWNDIFIKKKLRFLLLGYFQRRTGSLALQDTSSRSAHSSPEQAKVPLFRTRIFKRRTASLVLYCSPACRTLPAEVPTPVQNMLRFLFLGYFQIRTGSLALQDTSSRSAHSCTPGIFQKTHRFLSYGIFSGSLPLQAPRLDVYEIRTLDTSGAAWCFVDQTPLAFKIHCSIPL